MKTGYRTAQHPRASVAAPLFRLRATGAPAPSILQIRVSVLRLSPRRFPVKPFAVALSLLLLVGAVQARAATMKADPSAYTIAVHVSESDVSLNGGSSYEDVIVAIAGKHYRLRGSLTSGSLINPGDYHARLINDTHKTSYLTEQEYEFLFPDGATWRCSLAGQWE
jgi:hypothetical protein